ncbi:ferredoxin [Halorubellus sp. JP-L1]|uniref:ferredoxin n=1 Tax=Halorubellus sp. JP-L1 TaxID=2715753 RepID=UPI0014089F92|nr:ferredoxin [Halorubellus sp. JP-L1]NHN41669.1 ferredoxin [Halorubellus sp. JP-L1]
MTTEYAIELDREACDGVFACLVRDDRFVEGDDGLATVEDGGDAAAVATDGADDAGDDETLVVAFDDDRVEDARQAARACPVDAIEVTVEGDDA